MTKINFRSCLPYAIALIIFILIAYIYASPVLEGKIINQADISSYQGSELITKETILKLSTIIYFGVHALLLI